MAVKDISDLMVCKAFVESRKCDWQRWPYEFLTEWTGQPEKVCFRAMERADRRKLVDYGVSLRSGWLTQKGEALLRVGNDVSCVKINQQSALDLTKDSGVSK